MDEKEIALKNLVHQAFKELDESAKAPSFAETLMGARSKIYMKEQNKKEPWFLSLCLGSLVATLSLVFVFYFGANSQRSSIKLAQPLAAEFSGTALWQGPSDFLLSDVPGSYYLKNLPTFYEKGVF